MSQCIPREKSRKLNKHKNYIECSHIHPSKTCRRQYRAADLSTAHLPFKALRDPTIYTVYPKAPSKARPLIHLPCLTRSSQCLDQEVMTYTSAVISSLSKESLSCSLLAHQSISSSQQNSFRHKQSSGSAHRQLQSPWISSYRSAPRQ